MSTRLLQGLVSSVLSGWLTVPAQGQTISLIRQFGSSAFDVAVDVATDGTGVYMVGWTFGTLPGQSSAGNQDAFVRRYDAAGSEVWTRQFGSNADDLALGVAVNGAGMIAVGQTFGTLPGQTSFGGSDAFVRRYDGSGNVVWTRQFGTSAGDVARAVSADATGIYAVGAAGDALPGQISFGGSDAFVRKYDASGNVVWTSQFGSAFGDEAFGVAADATGVYVVGVTGGAGFGDAFVRKYDANGNELWTRQFGSPDWPDLARDAAVDATGVYVIGWTYGVLPGQSGFGDQDAFVRKYDPSGNELWTRQFGSLAEDRAFGVAADATGISVVGWTYDALPGQTSFGSLDAFVRTYDGSGNDQWTLQFGTSSGDGLLGAAVDASGLYAAGGTGGSLPGQSSSGNSDAFLVKVHPPVVQTIEVMADQVQSLGPPSGPLNTGQVSSLTQKLQRTLEMLRQSQIPATGLNQPSTGRNQTGAACNVLAAFGNEVNGLISGRVLSTTQGTALAARAQGARQALQCAPL